MRQNSRIIADNGDRIVKTVRASLKSDVVRKAGVRVKSFMTHKPILSTCLGLAAGIVLGLLIPRGK